MNDSVKVDATKITVAKPFPRAPQPGDQLLVIDGVCIGFYQNGPTAPSAAPTMPPAKSDKRSRGSRLQPQEDEKIFAVLREHGPMDARHILDALGADPRTDARRTYGQRINRMARRGVIRPVKADKNKAQPHYEISGS